MALPRRLIGGQLPPPEDSDSTSSSENHNTTNNSSYYEPMEPPTTSELTFMPRSPPVVQRIVGAGNATFYGGQVDSSNKTFNGNASTWSIYDNTIAPTGNTTTYGGDGHQAEMTFGGPYTDLIPKDLNSTFFGHTLLGSQLNNQSPTPAATKANVSLVGTQNPNADNVIRHLMKNGKDAGVVDNFETPKSSKKRKRHDASPFQHDPSFDILIEPFIAMMRNPDLPFGAKMGCATSIEAILTANPMKSVKILAQEDFLKEIEKVLEITVLNPYSGNNTETILKILDRISCLSTEAKALVQTCCFQALNTLRERANLVEKANELLGQLRKN